MPIAFRVTGTLEVESVTAQVEGASVGLVYSPTGYISDPQGHEGGPFFEPAWTNSLDTVGIPRGTHTLHVTATDALANQGVHDSTINIDQPPTLTINPPFSGTVHGTNLSLSITFADDGAPVRLVVDASGGTSFTATNTSGFFHKDVVFDYPGQSIIVTAEVTDNVGQKTTISRTYLGGDLVPDSSRPGWQVVDICLGTVFDVADGRTVSRFVNEEFQGLVVHGFGGSNEARIPTGQVAVAKFVGGGVLYATTDNRLSFWRDGTNTVVGDCNPPESLVVAGDWAAWGNLSVTYAWHLPAGPIQTVDGNGQWAPKQRAVASNGLVVYTADNGASHGIFRWQRGTSSPMVISGDSKDIRQNPVTDGQRVAYTLSLQNGPANIAVYFNNTETIVGTPDPSAIVPYAMADGWFAWSALGNGGVAQVWRQGVLGVAERLTIFGTSSKINWMGAGGWFVYNSTELARPDRPVLDVLQKNSTPFSSFYESGGRLYASINRPAVGSNGTISTSVVYRYAPTPVIAAFPGGLLQVNAPTYSTAEVQATTDFLQWTKVGTLNFTNDAAGVSVDASQTGFYRAVAEP